jgi:probable lipoprotein NlpC
LKIRNVKEKRLFFLRYLCLLGFILLGTPVFAAVPIQGTTLPGTSASEARKKVITAAESFLGTRYRYGGIDKGGMDCSGLVYASFKNGINYSTPRTVVGIYNWVEKIETAELKPGDFVFFITVGAAVSHVGIYIGGGRFIHSASEGPSTGVIFFLLFESYWSRTYRGAGRALPWAEDSDQLLDEDLSGEDAFTDNSHAGMSFGLGSITAAWAEGGLFAGVGASWTWGGFFEGAPSLFRGASAQAAVGYKWEKFRAGLELRPEWDGALGVFRLPLVFFIGTDIFQGFAGTAYTFGRSSLNLKNGERHYSDGFFWLGELGFSASFPVMQIKTGLFFIYAEAAWQPYIWDDDESFSLKPDLTANLRFSTGARYFWKL